MISVQEVFNKFYPDYKNNNTPSPQQAKAAADIIACRTEAMGTRNFKCDECSYTSSQYNSCRNRHCTMCQNLLKTMWADQRANDVIDAPYFHLVFTVPKELRELIYRNQEIIYPLLYKAVAETIKELSGDSKYLGAQIGFFSMLHTWSQDLYYHPHIHTVLMSGGLTKINKWKTSSKKFFIPVKVLGKVFRGKLLYYLKKEYEDDKNTFFGLKETSFQSILDFCYKKDWYIYSKETLKGPLAVIRYLGRYTHRVAISNERILSMNENNVTILVKDRKNSNKQKTVTMTGIEFVRRFLMHILPKRFVKIRYYGILSCRNKKTKLVLCRKLSNSATYKARYTGLSKVEIIKKLFGKDISVCPCCKFGSLVLSLTIPKSSVP